MQNFGYIPGTGYARRGQSPRGISSHVQQLPAVQVKQVSCIFYLRRLHVVKILVDD